MKTIGILGGMSAASTQIYYRTLCDLTQDRFGGLTSPDLLIRSLDFAPLAACMKAGDWASIARSLNTEARHLCDGGADLLLLASNTMHKLADEVMDGVDIPLLHIADVTASAVAARGFARPAFIATGFTMEERFYLDRLERRAFAPSFRMPGNATTSTGSSLTSCAGMRSFRPAASAMSASRGTSRGTAPTA